MSKQLMNFVQNGDLESVKLEIFKENNMNIKHDALLWAAQNGHLNIVMFLEDHGCDIHIDKDSACKWSAEGGHLDVVRYLVDKGANIHTDNNYALRQSAAYDMFEMIEFIIDRGGDVELAREYGTKNVQVWCDKYIASKELSKLLTKVLNSHPKEKMLSNKIKI